MDNIVARPVIDGTRVGLRERPILTLEAGRGNKVPVVMGSTADEGSLFVPFVGDLVPGVKWPLANASLPAVMGHFFNSTTRDEVVAEYDGNFSSADKAADIILRDFFFTCATRRALRAMDRHGWVTFMYFFDYPLDNWVDWRLLGNYHTSELSFVFDNQVDAMHQNRRWLFLRPTHCLSTS